MNTITSQGAGSLASGGGTLTIEALVKHFGKVRANDGISFTVGAREIHALLGENGAGKSTLIKILAGVYQPDSGLIAIDGHRVAIESPAQARDHGIAIVHQHSTLVPRLTVFENVVIQDGGIGRPDATLADRLVESGRRLGFDLDPKERVERLTLGERQRVEIARALMIQSRFVILDEPTAVLSPAERADFFGLLDRLADEGAGVVFVTHHLGEALAHSRRFTVLRLGRVVGEGESTTDISQDQLVEMMVGELPTRPQRVSTVQEEELVQVVGLSGTFHDRRRLEDVSFVVKAGEVLGVAGVEGNGQRELAAALTGAWRPERGQVLVRGQQLTDYSPATRSRLVADIPDDHQLATVDELTIWENLGLTRMAWSDGPGPRAKRRLKSGAQRLVRDFDIRTSSIGTRVGQLSGGNRRRVVIARELSKQPTVVVASFATKGLDVRSAEQVKQWTRTLAAAGAAVVYISSDLEELLDVSDRIAVMARGRVTGLVDGRDADVQAIGRLMLVSAED